MENSKLSKLLRSFSKNEFEDFGKFINSPYFNSSEQITKFYKLVSKHYPDLNSPELDKKNIFKAIFGRENYKDKKMRDLLSRITKLAEDFLAINEFRTMQLSKKRLVLKQLAKKDLDKHFTSFARESELLLDKEKITDSGFFFNKYSILKEKRSYLETQKSVGKRVKFFDEITKEIDAFIYYSIYKILKYYITFEIHSRLIKHDYDYKLRGEIMDFLKSNPADNYPVIMIYNSMILMNTSKEENPHYYKTIELLEKNIKSIHLDDLKLIYTELYNYTRIRALKGDKQFQKENYRILKDMVEKGVYPAEGNHLTENSLISIFSSALIEKDYDWALKFLDEHIDMLPPESKQNTSLYSMGILNYRKRNYQKALDSLSRVSIDDFYYHIRVKNHEIKIFFELGDYEKVLFTIDSFRHFLASNKLIPDYLKVRFLNYANYSGRIANALLSSSPGDKVIPIKKEIDKHDVASLENRTWLLEQIENIKK